MLTFKKQRGHFVKDCPCSPQTVSCGYLNLNLHTGCPYQCSYCILQSYLTDSSEPIFFTNFKDMEEELQRLSREKKYIRIGTGELTDSLAFDDLSNYSVKLMEVFKEYPDMVFEFKTKSANIKNLIHFPMVLDNIVVAWSLNPQSIIQREEKKTPSLKKRLEAMQEVQGKGYKIAIHFDPLIMVRDYKKQYRELILTVKEYIDPSQIVWWSLGALRFPYSLREHIFKHKESHLFEGELIKGYDDKYRYLKPLRIELFFYVRDQIYQEISRHLPLYLCMEDEETWEEILPQIKPKPEIINKILYQSVFR